MTNLIQSLNDFEILTTKELLIRLKISRTKLCELKRKGTLIPARHYIQNGRVLRFVWGADLIETIHENPEEKEETTDERTRKSKAFPRHRAGRGAINLDY
jgi:hypothetical protein